MKEIAADQSSAECDGAMTAGCFEFHLTELPTSNLAEGVRALVLPRQHLLGLVDLRWATTGIVRLATMQSSDTRERGRGRQTERAMARKELMGFLQIIVTSNAECGSMRRRTLVARYGEPPRSGWLRIINFRCTLPILSLSAPKLPCQATFSTQLVHQR
eukprot:992760-Rhodomonas_salina.1